jgi:GT2 family glycosyltransferase
VGHGMEDGPAFSERRVIYAVPWTAALFRTALFDKTGLLDERFVSYLEDVDFGVRCAALRLAGEYVPEALAWHEGSATLGRWSAETVRSIARNQTLLAARWLGGRDFWNVAVAQSLWGLAALRHRRALAWAQGKWQGLHCWNDARSTYDPHAREALRGWLHENERVIRGDASWFWRVYSLLTPGEAM